MSNVKQCPNGHFYNADENPSSCPWCGAPSDGGRSAGGDSNATRPVDSYGSATRPINNGANGNYGGETVPINQGSNNNYGGDKTVPLNRGRAETGSFNRGGDEGVTKRFTNIASGVEPVVGWLVCKEGVNRGKDYKLRSGFNRIGRSPELEVYISGDDMISRTETASIVYDDHRKQFFIGRGIARDLAYLNGAAIIGTQELVSMDVIAMGNSEFIFIPLCGKNFSW